MLGSRRACRVKPPRARETGGAAEVYPDARLLLSLEADDKLFVGVRPDGTIEASRDILEEEDGPMLLHGLKRLHQTRLHAPRRAKDRPDPNLLEIRYERFVAAGG